MIIPAATMFGRKNFSTIAATALAAIAVPLFVVSFSVSAAPAGKKKTPPDPPKCAILDQGRVTCPDYITGAGTCWYEDPGGPNAGSKQGWVKTGCDSDIFKSASFPPVTTSEDPALTPCKRASHCDVVKTYIDPLIATLAAGVGVVCAISIVVGGIQYASSAGDPQKAAAARSRITNTIIALIGFFLLFAFISWLLPGGLLNG